MGLDQFDALLRDNQGKSKAVKDVISALQAEVRKISLHGSVGSGLECWKDIAVKLESGESLGFKQVRNESVDLVVIKRTVDRFGVAFQSWVKSMNELKTCYDGLSSTEKQYSEQKFKQAMHESF